MSLFRKRVLLRQIERLEEQLQAEERRSLELAGRLRGLDARISHQRAEIRHLNGSLVTLGGLLERTELRQHFTDEWEPKRRYDSDQAATAAAANARARAGHPTIGAYRCALCRGWHIGHAPARAESA